MKKKTIIFAILFVASILVIIFLVVFKLKSDGSIISITETEYVEYDIDINNQDNSEYNLENGEVSISNFSVSEENGTWYLTFYVKNNSNKEVDLQEKYVLYVYDKDGNLLHYYDQRALGIIEANSLQENEMKINYDGSKIARLELKSK